MMNGLPTKFRLLAFQLLWMPLLTIGSTCQDPPGPGHDKRASERETEDEDFQIFHESDGKPKSLAVARSRLCVRYRSSFACASKPTDSYLVGPFVERLSQSTFPENKLQFIETTSSGICWKLQGNLRRVHCESDIPSSSRIFDGRTSKVEATAHGDICTLYEGDVVCVISTPLSDEHRTERVNFSPDGDPVDLSISPFHFCIIGKSGRLSCHFYPSSGAQRGAREKDRGQVFKQTDGFFFDVAAADNATCALEEDKGLLCWGKTDCPRNLFADRRFSTKSAESGGTSPIAPKSVAAKGCDLSEEPRRIVASNSHFCVVSVAGSFGCWGDLKISNTERFWQEVDTKENSICGLSRDGHVECWGQNEGLAQALGLAPN